MQFKKISAPSLKELFVQQLEDMILSGRLEIGAQLPPERELAETMQISRSVVNAGINEMAAKGFLEIRPRIGTFVGDYRRHGTMETLLSIMKYNGGRLRRDEVRSILQIKLVLDRLAVQGAMSRITKEELAILGERLEMMAQAQQKDSQMAEATFGFHHELALLSGNTLIPLIYYSFRQPILGLWGRFSRKYGHVLYQNAADLYTAMCAGDLPAAERSVETAIGNTISGSTEIYFE